MAVEELSTHRSIPDVPAQGSHRGVTRFDANRAGSSIPANPGATSGTLDDPNNGTKPRADALIDGNDGGGHVLPRQQGADHATQYPTGQVGNHDNTAAEGSPTGARKPTRVGDVSSQTKRMDAGTSVDHTRVSPITSHLFFFLIRALPTIPYHFRLSATQRQRLARLHKRRMDLSHRCAA